MRSLRRPIRLGLQARITALAAIGVVAVFVTMGVIGLTNQTASMHVVLEQRQALAETVASQVDYNIGHVLAELTAASSEPGFALSDADLTSEQAALAGLYRSGMFSYDVFLTDARGIVLAVEPESLRADLVGADFSAHPHVRRAMETGQPHVSGLISGVAVPGQLISLVVPVKNARDEIVGLIGGALDPGSPAISGFIAPMALGETGYAQVVDGQGMVIASTISGAAGAPSQHHDLILSLIQRGEPTTSPDTFVTEAGKEFYEVIAFAPVPRLGWAVTVEQDRGETLAPVIAARNQILLAASVTLALAMLLVWITTQWVTRPVLALAGAARRIASGDLATPTAVAGPGELAELGRNFETMRRRLAAWGEELEAAVQNRTRQLSVLYAIDRAAAQSLELDAILTDALDKVLEVLEVEAGGIFLLEPDGETMTLRVSRGLSDEFVENVQRIHLGEGISGRAAAERQVVVLDVADYPTERLAPAIIQAGFQTLASTPLLSAGELVGALNVGTRRPRAFPPEEMDLLTSIGQQLGGAVANARLHQETRQRAERLSILNRIAHALAATLNLDELLEIVHREIMAVVEADTFFIALYDGEANELDFRIQIDKGVREPPERRPVAPGLTAAVVTGRQPLLIRDFEREKDHLPPVKLWGTMQAPQSWLGLPLLLGQEVIGVISVQAYRTSAFDEADQQVLSTIADAVAVAVENTRLYEAERRRAARLAAMQRLGIELAVLRDESAVLNTLVTRAAALAESPACTVSLVDAATNEAVLAAQTGLPEGTPIGLRVPLTLPLLRHALETGESIIAPQIDRDAPELRGVLIRKDVQASFIYPLAREGRILGFLTLSRLVPHRPSAEEVTAYRLLAERAATALVNVRLHQSLLASEQEYRTLVENATELIWTVDTEGRFTYLNRQAEQVSGYRAEDWIGKSFAPLVAPPEDLPRIQQIFLKTLAGKPQSYEVGVYRADGSIVRLSVNTTPLYRSGDAQAVGTISFGRDVTAQQEAEAALTQRMAELSSLFEVSSALRGAKSVDEILPIILEETVKVVGADCGAIFLVNQAGGELIACATHGRLMALHGLRLERTEGVCGYVAQTRVPYPFSDLARDVHTGARVQPLVAGVQGGMCVPLLTGETLVGTLIIGNDASRTFRDDEVRLLTAIADMAASAIHRAGLFEQLEYRVHELSALFEVSGALRGVEGVEDMLPVIVDKAVEVCRADCGSVSLLDESGEMLVCRFGTGARQALVGARLRLGQGISGRVAQSGAPHLNPDFQHDPLLAFDPATPARLPEIASDVCVPLRVGEQIVGAMHVSAYTVRTFTEAETRLLTAIADMAASAIRRAGLLDQLEHRVHELSTLFDVGKMATASLHIEDVLQFVAGAAIQSVHAEGSYLFLWDEREERLVLRASQGFPAEDVGRMKYRLGEGLCGWVFLERQVVNAPDLAADPRWKREPEHEAPLASGRANSALIIPLVIGKKALGVLGVINKIGAPVFAPGDESLLTTLAGQIAIAIENARLYEEVRDLSIAAIRSLATAIDARDPYTRGHSEGVTVLAVQLARELGWSGADLEMIEFAALLHDVGKIAVPDAVLMKVEPLTADEWTIIRLHPYHSAQIVKPVESLRRIVSWVYHHQERWDGTGYPDGVKGEAIPLASRIIAVADAFNAMTTDRPYRKALAVAEALAEIARSAGSQFDPAVAGAFLRMMEAK